MIRETEDTFESCWSFPHHLKLGVRVRSSDGEPVLFIQSTAAADIKPGTTVHRASCPPPTGIEVQVPEPRAAVVPLKRFSTRLRAFWGRMRAWRVLKQVPGD
jgi:hypothetical protein